METKVGKRRGEEEGGKHTAAGHEGDRRGVDRIQHAGRGQTKSGNGLEGMAAHGGVVMARDEIQRRGCRRRRRRGHP